MDGRDLMNSRSQARMAVASGFALVGLVVSGCGGTTSGGDPGARALPSGQSCQSVRAEMDKLLARGVQPRVEAAQAGRKLPPQQQAEVDQYNRLLAQYLGARCHQ